MAIRPPAPAPGTSITMPLAAGDPCDVITRPDSLTSFVAMRPNDTLMFSCDTASVTRDASLTLGVPG